LKKLLLFLLLIFSILLQNCHQTPVEKNPVEISLYETPPLEVPNWFINLPESNFGTILGVGYTGRVDDLKRGKEIAIERALIKMAKQKEVRLIFNYITTENNRFSLTNLDYNEIYEEDFYNQIADNYRIVDSMLTQQASFVLLVYPASSTIKVKSDKQVWGQEPDWIKNLPRENNKLYGVGYSSRYTTWTRAWKDIDEFARFSLVSNLKIKVSNELQYYKDDRYDITLSLTEQICDMTIRKSTIIKRWYNPTENIYYSLCQAFR